MQRLDAKSICEFLLPAILVGCAAIEKPLLEQPIGETHHETPPAAQPPEPVPAEGVTLSVSGDPVARGTTYHRLCDLPDDAREAPHFPFDSAVLGIRGKAILDRVANCRVRGKLMGESVIVIGYADPRGGDAYNLALALERAETAASYLVNRGVPSHRVSVASRGEHYSRGRRPEGWHFDRRVELELDSGESVKSP